MLKPYSVKAVATQRKEIIAAKYDDAEMYGEGLKVDMPLNMQIQRLIHSVGPDGITSASIRRSLNNFNDKLFDYVIGTLTDGKKESHNTQCVKKSVFFGKQRRNMYSSKPRFAAPLSEIIQPVVRASPVTADLEPTGHDLSQSASKMISDPYKRKEVLLELLSKHAILEQNANLIDLFAAHSEAERLNPFRIDKKTVLRIADGLAKKGLLKISTMTFSYQNGNLFDKTFYRLPEINIDDEVYLEFVSDIRDKQFLNTGKSTGFTGQLLSESDVGLDRRDVVMKKVQCSASLESGIITPPSFDDEKANTQLECDAIEQNAHTNSWFNISLNYGYLSGKFARASVFHSYLVDIMQTTDDERIFKNAGKFSLISIYRNIPFGLYLKLVCTTTICPEFDTFIATFEGYEDIPMDDLSLSLKKVISTPKFKKAIAKGLEILEALKLIKRDRVSESNANQVISYVLMSHVPLHNHKLPDRPFLRYIDVRNAADSFKYFESLKLVSLVDTEIDYDLAISQLVESSDALTSNISSGDVLSNITRNVQWGSSFKINEKLTDILDAYFDSATGATPLNDSVLLATIALATLISVPRIKGYYRKKAEMFARTANTRLRKQGHARFLAMQKGGPVIPKTASVELTETAKKIRNQHGRAYSQKKLTAVATGIPLEISSVKKRDTAKAEKKKSLNPSEPGKRVRGVPFTDEEAELFVYAYAIVASTRLKIGRSMLWIPIKDAMNSDVETRKIKVKFCTAMKCPRFERRINHLCSLWSQVMLEDTLRYGPEFVLFNALIEKPDVDISEHILLLKAREIDEMMNPTQLDIAVVNVTPKRAVFVQTPATVQPAIPHDVTVYMPLDKEMERINLIVVLIKVILLIPELDSETTKALDTFSEPEIETAKKFLYSHGLAIAKSTNRRFKNRDISLSSKFFNALSGAFPPKCIQQARLFSEVMRRSDGSIRLPRMCTNGVMMSMLDLLNDRKIVLQIGPTIEEHATVIMHDFDVQAHDEKRYVDDCVTEDAPAKRSKFTNDEASSNEEMEFIATPIDSLSAAIAEYISLFSEDGVEVNAILLEFRQYDEKTVLIALRNTVFLKLIIKTGFDAIRYVSTKFSSAIMESYGQSSDPSKAFLLNARTWVDALGNDIMFIKKCLIDSVLSKIVTNPGISEYSLGVICESFLSKLELSDLLSTMEVSGLIISMISYHVTSSSFFDDDSAYLTLTEMSKRVHYLVVNL